MCRKKATLSLASSKKEAVRTIECKCRVLGSAEIKFKFRYSAT